MFFAFDLLPALSISAGLSVRAITTLSDLRCSPAQVVAEQLGIGDAVYWMLTCLALEAANSTEMSMEQRRNFVVETKVC